jgi:hypothetical protein
MRLSDQLVQPLLDHLAIALGVHVASVRSARGLTVDEHAKAHRRSARRRAHDEMHIAGVTWVSAATIAPATLASIATESSGVAFMMNSFPSGEPSSDMGHRICQ